jgi:Tfp pilus assembly protein PilV
LIRGGPAARGGFTLIEVSGAILIFSVGVIMVLQITSALSRRTEYAAMSSMINVMGQQRLDSLSVVAYASVPAVTTTDTITVRGVGYRRQLVVTQYSPLVRKLDFTLSPLTGPWPTFDASSYVRDPW